MGMPKRAKGSKTSEDGIEVGETQVVNRVHENTEQSRQLEKDVLRQRSRKGTEMFISNKSQSVLFAFIIHHVELGARDENEYPLQSSISCLYINFSHPDFSMAYLQIAIAFRKHSLFVCTPGLYIK